MSDIVIPEEAVEAGAKVLSPAYSQGHEELGPWARNSARAVLVAALPALRARRVELGAVYGYELGRSDTASEIADLIQKRRDECVEGSAAWRKYNEAVQIAERIGRQP